MPTVVEFKISGLSELEDALERAPLRASRRIMRYALLAAGEVWRREMEARVRRGWHHWRKKGKGQAPTFGYLSQHIVARVSVKSDLEGTVRVGPAKAGFWSLFLEFGTRHAPAFPFIRQAFESRKHDVLDEFTIELRAALRAEGLILS